MNICIFCKIAVMLAKKNAFFEAFFFTLAVGIGFGAPKSSA